MTTIRNQRSIEQLAVLYRIGRAVCSTLELDEVLDRILDDTLGAFAAEAGSVMLIKDEYLRIRRARGLSPAIVESTVVPVGKGIAGYVAASGEMLLLNGKVDSKQFEGAIDRGNLITSSLCAPLRSRNGIMGVIMVRRGSSEPFSQEQLDFFSSVADQAAIAIENARLFSSEQQRSRQLRDEQQKMLAVYRSMADGVVVLDGNGLVSMMNVPAQRLLGVDESFVGGCFAERFGTFPIDHICEELRRSGGVYELDMNLARKGGTVVLRVAVTAWGECGDSVTGMVLLLHDVTERVQVERMKTEFLSAVSHELKTPITTVSGFIELMLDREFERRDQERYLSICLGESQRLQRLIEDLLTLSKLESGHFEFYKQQASIVDIVTRVVANFSARYPAFSFAYSGNQQDVCLELDDTLVTQVLINLLSNAVKYSSEAGAITVYLEATDSQVTISVQDQGIGIPRDKIPYVFDKFYRVDNSLTRKTGGTGLGLANARYIVEGHGGSVWVESQLGKGSKFSFMLPRKQNIDHCEATGENGSVDNSGTTDRKE